MAVVAHTPHPDLPPPLTSVGVVGWLRQNLFSTPLNSLLTLGALYLLYLTLPPMINWALLDADWSGTSRDACSGDGACWVFIQLRFLYFMVGFYPEAELWRPVTVFGMTGLMLLYLLVDNLPRKTWVAGFALLLFPFIAFFLLYGGLGGLSVVDTHQWGGLMLTLILSTVGMFFALPFGTLLALGRRSSLTVPRTLSVLFIELWRGVPLITVLFMSSVLLPLFMPDGVRLDKLLRALLGISLFQSAYMAEVIRSGLQSVPKGQYEAADALGLSYWQAMLLIILPQALKTVIPGIVNTFIELFKDTTLVLIIGLFDLLATVQASFTDSKWLGFSAEGYIFAGLIYWLFCFSMSRYSYSLEKKLHTGH
ncbi:MAG: amino acid ABC transporter permease [Candidatus Electrothrix sp. MAN1_4]|nr:amino acid ABC transporter permease [Candidatus Electrothrix sp. MAN1_4]